MLLKQLRKKVKRVFDTNNAKRLRQSVKDDAPIIIGDKPAYNLAEWYQHLRDPLPALTEIWDTHRIYRVDGLLVREFHEPVILATNDMIVMRWVLLCVGLHTQDLGERKMLSSMPLAMSVGEPDTAPVLHLFGRAGTTNGGGSDITNDDTRELSEILDAPVIHTVGPPGIQTLQTLRDALEPHVQNGLAAPEAVAALGDECRRRSWGVAGATKLCYYFFEWYAAGLFEPKDQCDLVEVVERFRSE